MNAHKELLKALEVVELKYSPLKTIPVQMAGNNEQLALMSAQLERLDDLVRVMQSQLGVSERILKYAQ